MEIYKMSSNKSVVFFFPFFGRTQNAFTSRMLPIMEEFKNQGFEVEVITPKKEALLDSHVKIHTLNLSLLSNQSGFLKRAIMEILLGLESVLLIYRLRLRKKFIILSSPPFFTTLLISFFLRKKNYHLDVRDLYPEVFFSKRLMKEEGLMGRILKGLTKRFYSNAYSGSVVTPNLSSHLSISYNVNFNLIFNGYNESQVQSVQPEKFEVFTVMFHGTLGGFQNVALLREFIVYLFDNYRINFYVVGAGPESRIISDLKYEGFFYKPELSTKDIYNLVSRCHLGVSFRDDTEISKNSLPVKIFEYIGNGVPCISTPITEVRKVFNDVDAVMVCENELSAIISSFESVYNNTFELSITEELRSRFSRSTQSKEFVNGITLKGSKFK